jgi:AraC-like DNA-binding protein
MFSVTINNSGNNIHCPMKHDIKSLIDFNIVEIKTIADLAQRTGLSVETLRKGFFREEKIHLGEYISRRKVEAMKELLQVSDEPCNVVCFSVGLREDSGSKIFKKVTGMTMVEYRNEKRKQFGGPPLPSKN